MLEFVKAIAVCSVGRKQEGVGKEEMWGF